VTVYVSVARESCPSLRTYGLVAEHNRLVGIIREYKNKGIDTGYMEQAFDQPDRLVGAAPFGGWQLDNCMQYMTELCQLPELAYHVDANDQPIYLVANSKEQEAQ